MTKQTHLPIPRLSASTFELASRRTRLNGRALDALRRVMCEGMPVRVAAAEQSVSVQAVYKASKVILAVIVAGNKYAKCPHCGGMVHDHQGA
jgi:hypothetical protein